MTTLPDGHSDSAESRRQVMVVEEDPARSQRWCTLLTRHGLTSHAVSSGDLALAVQGWPGIILVGSKSTGRTGWELAERIRMFDRSVPIIMIGTVKANPAGLSFPIQAYLPANVSDDSLVDEVERWLRQMPPPERRPTLEGSVLLVDDDPKFRTILADFLTYKGFRVVVADCGEAARQQLGQELPRVVLLDVKMPGMDGLLTLKHIRMTHPNLPVIFTTNVDEDEVMREAWILGANDYLIKPFNFEHLETILLTKIFA